MSRDETAVFRCGSARRCLPRLVLARRSARAVCWPSETMHWASWLPRPCGYCLYSFPRRESPASTKARPSAFRLRARPCPLFFSSPTATRAYRPNPLQIYRCLALTEWPSSSCRAPANLSRLLSSSPVRCCPRRRGHAHVFCAGSSLQVILLVRDAARESAHTHPHYRCPADGPITLASPPVASMPVRAQRAQWSLICFLQKDLLCIAFKLGLRMVCRAMCPF